MGQRYFPRLGKGATTAETRVGDGVMGTTERTGHQKGLVASQQSRHRVDLGGLQRLGECQRRQDAGKAFGQHGLARSGTPDEQHVMGARRSNLQSPLDILLAFDILKVKIILVLSHQ